jgi:BASS family bile acid:Na+ symporter
MILSGAIALHWPRWLATMNQGSLMVLLLAFIMLCMGLTLTAGDFRRIARMPREVLIGLPRSIPSCRHWPGPWPRV